MNKALREFRKKLCRRTFDHEYRGPQQCSRAKGHDGGCDTDWDNHEEMERLRDGT